MNTRVNAYFGGLILLLLIGLIFFIPGWVNTYGLFFGVPVFERPFSDLQVILYDLETYRKGLDPYLISSDPMALRSFYPKIWMLFSYLPFISINHYTVLVCMLFIALVAALVSVYGSLNPKQWLYAILLVLSPAVMFCLERCNTDILIFVLLVLMVHCFHKEGWYWPGVLLWLFTFALKLYPLFAGAVFLQDKNEGRRRLFLILSCLSILVYLFSISADLKVISKASIPAIGLTYGLLALPLHMASYFGIPLYLLKTISYLFIVAIMGYFFFKAPRTAKKESYCRSESFFLLGAMIYLLTYLMGYNYDYKLLFLLLLVPYLFEQKGRSTLAKALLVVLPICLWSNFITMQLSHLQTNLPYMALVYWPNASYIWVDEGLNLLLFILLFREVLTLLPIPKIRFSGASKA